VPGPQGDPGNDSVVPGPQGDPGDSAYEIAVANGFSGTESEWLDSLEGADSVVAGPPGDPGEPGVTGDGFTGGSYDASTGIVTFTSDDGLGFTTGDLRGADGTNGSGGLEAGDNVSELANDAGYLDSSDLIVINEEIDTINEELGKTTSIAKGAALNLKQELIAATGQPGLTVLVVANTTTGKVQGISLGGGNVIEVYSNGSAFANDVVLYREFMSLGEPICFTGLSGGAIIVSTKGFYGVSDQANGGNESPMPLCSLGLAFTNTFFYAFRNSESPASDNRGEVYITAGPLPTQVSLFRPDNGSFVNDPTFDGNNGRLQQNILLEAFESTTFVTNANTEYQLLATNPVMAAVQARMGGGNPRFYDARLIMPTTDDGITWPRSGNVSAPYDNTVVDYYVRDGASGSFTVSPGSPVDFDDSTGAIDADYETNGATRVRAVGLLSAYSGADSAGLEASPLCPTSAMSQIVAQPFFIDDNGDGGNSGVAIASPYEGTAKVYQWNDVTGVAELAYTVPLTRGNAGAGITLATPDDQNFPCSGLVANENQVDPSVIQLVGTLNPGYVIADVPVTVVSQNGNPGAFTATPVRSQNGTTTFPILCDDDETLVLGVTPPSIKIELTTDVGGFLRKRVLAADGSVTYPLV
jgi:hypothetical protein